MRENTPFIAHVPSFSFGGDALLLLADHSTIVWLNSKFADLARTQVESSSAAFVIGDGKPIQSDGRCIISVELNRREKGSELVQQSPTTFRWILSASSAGRYADLLSGMSNSEAPCHQYLDPDNAPPAPVVIVSFDEYEADTFRRAKG